MDGSCIDLLMQQTERNAHLFSLAVNWPWPIFQNTAIDNLWGGQINCLERDDYNTRLQIKWSFDGNSHSIGPIIGGQRRCASWGKKVQKKCMKCNVSLHVWFFERFHTKWSEQRDIWVEFMNFTSKTFATCISKLYCFGIQLALQTHWHSILWYRGFTLGWSEIGSKNAFSSI